MTDLSAFLDEGFDPTTWINASCATKGPDVPLEKFLAELEMRLQLGAEEVEATLVDCSSAALRRVPFAQQEVSRLRDDVVALQASTKALVSSVAADAQAAAAAAAPLAALHTARSNMEAGCATLREAAELSGAFKRVEEVFAAGDLPRVADMLRNMAKSLALVGDVPEFREGRTKLASLEDRLQRRVEGRLADALQASSGTEVASLAGLLLAVGRHSSLELAYINSRMPSITAVWDGAAAMLSGSSGGGSAATKGQQQQQPHHAPGGGGLSGGWLLLLYNNLMAMFEADAAWLAGCLPAQKQQLLVALMTAAFEKANKLVRVKLSALHNTKVLGGLLGDVLVAARRLRELLSTLSSASSPSAAAAASTTAAAAAAVAGGSDDSQVEVRLLKLLLDPLEQQVSRYSTLEEPVISAALSAALPINTSNRPAAAAADDEELESEVAQKLADVCSAAFVCLSGVVERCTLLTGGTELPQLVVNVDRQLAGYLQRIQAAVGIVSGRYSRLVASGAAAADISIMLQLIVLARHITTRLSSLETQVRSTLAKILPRLQQSATAGLPPVGLLRQHSAVQPAAAAPEGGGSSGAAAVSAAAAAAAAELLPLRLAAFPAKLQPLSKLQVAASNSRFMSLPAANASGSALCEAITAAVYGALLGPVTSALAPLPSLPEWTAGSATAGVAPGAGAVVPSFSAYPLPAVTSVGEYLMALPQQLEVLLGEGEAAAAAGSGEQQQQQQLMEEEADELATEWLDKVVHGAGLLYADSILQIKQLSPAGSVQLAADVEYVNNVMSALAVAPPPQLVTFQFFAAAPADTFDQAAAAAVAGGSADAKVLKAIAVMRGITWDENTAAGPGGGSAAGSSALDH